MNEKAAVEELAFIKNIINESRKSFALSGKPYIFWGILIVIGLTLDFFNDIGNWDFDKMYYMWIILITVGWGYAYFESRKYTGKIKPTPLTGKILGGVWFACGVSMTIFGFIGTVSGAIKGVYVSPVLSLVLAIAYYVTGIIHNYTWLRNISIGWWAGAVFMLFNPGQFTNLIMAFMMIVLQIIPGIILLNKVKVITTTES